ncbi:MAG: zinc carboxypeptidase [Firmicutes bacterium]|nr:zinc carboxypeptidase [Bacillota bacterium]
MPAFVYDHYYDFAQLTDSLKKLAANYPDFAKLSSIGISPEGREIWLLTLTDFSQGAPEEKPAFYIDGNFHAGEVTSSMVALYTADYILDNSAQREVANLLKNTTFYIIPRVSPDGAEVYLKTPASLRSVPRIYPEAEQKPGLVPEDINGDGQILQMRQKSPYGDWKVSSLDDRLMVPRQPDELEGEFYRVYQEGMIHEPEAISGDLHRSNSLWGMDLNRNYPMNWDVEAKQSGAGPYPLSEPESKAVADFIITHPNISFVSTLHTTGGALLRLPGVKPEKEAPPLDIQIFKAIGKMAEEETDYYSINVFNEFFSDPNLVLSGAFDDWLYGNLGLPAYTLELWDLAHRAGVKNVYPRKEKSEKEIFEEAVKIMQFNDRVLQGKGFVPWTEFEHPQLGLVEIGGYLNKTFIQNCPPELLAAECHKVAVFLIRNAKTLPQLVLDSFKLQAVDENLWQLQFVVGNLGFLPTHLTQEAINLKRAKEIQVEISGARRVDNQPNKEKVGHLAGRVGRSFYHYSGYPTRSSADSTRKVTWMLKGQKGDQCVLKISCPTAGLVEKTFTLQ